MKCSRNIGIAILLSSWLLAAAAAAQSGPLQDLIAQQEQKLSEARSSHNQRDQATALNLLATLYRQTGDMQKALDYCVQALSIEQSARFRTGEAYTKDTMGRIYTDLGQEQQALDLFNEILPFWQSALNRKRAEIFHDGRIFDIGHASTLSNLGRVYNNLGDKQKALDYLNQALPVWEQSGNRSGQASTLDSIGRAYADMGQGQQAIEYFNRALALWTADGERGGEGLTLVNMGKAYADLGQKQKALESYNRALADFNDIGNRQGAADAFEYRGKLYSDLGQQQHALDNFNQALPLWREVGSRSGEALALNDIGRSYSDLGQFQKSLDFYNQALPIWHETGNRRGEAVTLSNMGRAYVAMEQPGKALDVLYQSLSLWRAVEDRRGQAFALSGIAWACFAGKEPDKALTQELAALSLAKAAGDPDIEGGIETALMIGFRSEHRNEEAILFGTEAVNSYQQIRKNIQALDKELQTGFVQSRSYTYRALAELLVESGRLGEAEQVLDLLKEEELKEVVRGAPHDAGARSAPLPLTGAQQKTEADLGAAEKTASTLTDMSVEFSALQSKASRTAQEDARLKELEAKIETANAEVSDFFRKTLYPDLAQRAGTLDANALLSKERSEVSRLQNTLASLGPGVIGIRLLLGDEHAYVLVVTPQARAKFELNVAPAELSRKVLAVRDQLRTPSSDPRPALADLYATVAGPFAEELASLGKSTQAKGRVPTLLWSLDGVMRYLPMAALYDGQHYMVERFNNILFTPDSYSHMTTSGDTDKAALRVLAMGLSKSYGGLPALPGVMPELEAVAHDPSVPASHGPMDGILLPDDRFTYAALKTELGSGPGFPVVHIASHFVLESGSGTEPYLMLGGDNAGDPQGFPLTLSQLEDSTVTFHGTRLLTLSACSTAKGDVAQDGMEMDSLGMIAQQKDAEAVLATLWDVNDASTSRIMSDFYDRWVRNPAQGKAEALRQAQLAFLHSPAATPNGGSGRGVQAVEEPVPPNAGLGYSHPYYWAPFVLIGNYR